MANAAERVGVDGAWVLRNLKRNAVLAGDRAAAVRSIELIGKHLGMFINRKQIDIVYADDADKYLSRLLELVGTKVVEHEPAQPLAITGDGQKYGLKSQAEDHIDDIVEEIA